MINQDEGVHAGSDGATTAEATADFSSGVG